MYIMDHDIFDSDVVLIYICSVISFIYKLCELKTLFYQPFKCLTVISTIAQQGCLIKPDYTMLDVT